MHSVNSVAFYRASLSHVLAPLLLRTNRLVLQYSLVYYYYCYHVQWRGIALTQARSQNTCHNSKLGLCNSHTMHVKRSSRDKHVKMSALFSPLQTPPLTLSLHNTSTYITSMYSDLYCIYRICPQTEANIWDWLQEYDSTQAKVEKHFSASIHESGYYFTTTVFINFNKLKMMLTLYSITQ